MGCDGSVCHPFREDLPRSTGCRQCLQTCFVFMFIVNFWTVSSGLPWKA